MERLSFRFEGGRKPSRGEPLLVGVVASGNLEILFEPSIDHGCVIEVETSARGFGTIWEAVLRDFHARHGLSVSVAIHDMGATPAVVSLRLDQGALALEQAST